jgi:ABC-type proline/glycine betaine transport system permease subunit
MNLVVVRMALILQRLAQNVTTEEGAEHKEKNAASRLAAF